MHLCGKKVVKQHGLQRSGTNYVKFLIENNLGIQVLSDFAGWKHGSVVTNIPIFVTAKHPFAWMVSVHAKFYSDLEFTDFLMKEHRLLDCEGRIIDKIGANSPIEYWNKMHREWLKHTSTFVLYEQVLDSPSGILERLANLWKVNIKEDYIDVAQIVLPSNEGHVLLSKSKFNKSYYLNKDYMNLYGSEDIDFISSKMDWDLLNDMGYKDLNS